MAREIAINEDIHPERPRPVIEHPSQAKVNILSIVLCAGGSAAAAVLLAVLGGGLPWSVAAIFGIFSATLAVSSMARQQVCLDECAPSMALPALAAFAAAGLFFWLAYRTGPGFAAPGAVALALAIALLAWGLEPARTFTPSLMLLIFCVPWLDPESSVLGYAWRSTLGQWIAALVGPLVGNVAAQGTTVTADSTRVALAWDVGGFWQLQLFLMAAFGLLIGSGWSWARRIGFGLLAVAAGLIAYVGFAASFVLIEAAPQRHLSPGAGLALELGWWAAAFAVLFLLSTRKPRSGVLDRRARRRQAAKRAEEMFV